MLDRSLSETARRPTLLRPDAAAAGWATSSALVPYPDAEAAMEARAGAIADGQAGELVWLLAHPPLYTAGVSAKAADLLDPGRFPVFRSGRGGQFTYHGPGQRVAYVMLDLSARGRDVRAFVQALQAWIIDALERVGVAGVVREGRVGVWVERPPNRGELARDALARGDLAREDKVAAIGVKLRRWVSFHGVSLNVEPDLSHFTGIVPCGVTLHGVTSLADLGCTAGMAGADSALKAAFVEIFGAVADAPPPI